jgi:hypothetical protein
MVKTPVFTSITDPNADLVAIDNIHNIGYYNSKILFGTMSTSHLYVKSTTAPNGTTSTEHDYSISSVYGGVIQSVVSVLFRNWGQIILNVGMAYEEAIGPFYYLSLHWSYSTNGGSTWTDGHGQFITLSGAYSPLSNDGKIIDIFYDGTYFWIILSTSVSSPAAKLIRAYLIGAGLAPDSSVISDLNGVYSGYYDADDGLYYCKSYNSGFYDVSFSATLYTFTETSNSNFIAPSTFNHKDQLYFIQNGVEYLLDQDHFSYLPKGLSTWTVLASTSPSTIGVIWDHNTSDEYIINYLIWNGYIYDLTSFAGSLAKIQAFAAIGKIGYDDWFTDYDNSLIYQRTLTASTDLKECQIRSYIERGSEARIETATEPFEDQAIQIYNDSNVLLIQGILSYAEDESSVYFVSYVKDFISIDLDKKVDYTGAGAETVATAMANIITTNFDYGSAGTLTSSATTYSFSFEAKPIREIFTEMAHLDGKIWYCTPSNQINLDAGTEDSGVDVLAASGTYCGIDKKTFLSKIGTVELWGKDGSYIKKSNNASNQYYSDVYPSLGQTELAALAASILSVNATKIIQYTLTEITGLTVPQVGKQITLEQNYDPELIASAQYYTKEIWYDAMTTILLKIIVHDALHYPMSQMGLTNEKVEAHVIALETKVDALAAPGGLISNTAYDASWSSVTTIGPSKNAVYNKIETLALKATTLTGAGAIAIDTDQAAHDLSANRTISIENDAGNNITHIETALTDSLVKIPTSSILYDIHEAMKDPTGFPSRTASAFTLTDGVNKCTVEVTVVSGSYEIWFGGIKHTISTTKSIECSDDEGIHAVYFDTDDTLKEIVNPDASDKLTLIRDKVLVTMFYWDATNNMSFLPTEERHGCVMDGITHYLHHNEFGVSYISGLSIADVIIGDGSLDSHAQFSIGSGSISDEDIGLTFAGKNSVTAGDILYKDGASGNWRKTTQSGFWVKSSGSATNRLYYNQYSSGSWKLTEVNEGDYVLCHIWYYTGKTDQIFAIMGENQYATLPLAREGAETEIGNIFVGNLASEEMKPAYTFIFQTDKDYANNINARIVEVDAGGADYISWLDQDLPRGAAVTNYVSQTITDGVTGFSPSENAVYDALALKADLSGATFTGALAQTTGQAITDNAIITADAADITDNDYAKFTANGVEGRSYSEAKTDLEITNGIIIQGSNTASTNWKSSYDLATGTSGTPSVISIENFSDPPPTYEVVASISGSYKGLTKTHTYPIHFVFGTISHRIYYTGAGNITSGWYLVKNLSTYNNILLGLSNVEGNNTFFVDANGTLRFYYSSGYTDLMSISTDVWYHLCIEIRNSILNVYVNGIMVYTTNYIYTRNTNTNFLISDETLDVYLDALYVGNSIDEAMSSLWAGGLSLSTKDEVYITTPIQLNQNPITNVSYFESVVTTGTAPLTIASTTKVTNLNVDLIDGIHVDVEAGDDEYLLKYQHTGTKIEASTLTETNVSNAVSASHARQHAITSTSDHTSTATAGKILKADANGLPVEATNTDNDVASAVSLKHAAATVAAGQVALTISGQELVLKNNAVSPAAITAIEQDTISNDATKIPTSSLVYAVKTTADNSVQKSGANTLADTFGLTPTTTNTNYLGSATKVFKGIYSRIFQSDDTITIQSGTNKDIYIKASGTGINYLYSANSGTAVVVFDQKAYNANPSANIGFRLIATSGGESGTVGYIYCSKLNATDGNYSSYMRFLTLLNGETASEVLRLATPVASADSYVQITNGKAGTSDTIIESAGTANTLRISCGASQSILFYHGSTYQGGFTPTGFSVLNKYMYCRNSSDTASAAGTLYLARRRTTSPFVVQNGDMIGQIVFEAYDGADRSVAFIRSYVTAASSSGDVPTDLRFYTTPDGSATPLEVLRLKTSIASADNYFSLTNSTASGEAILTTSSASSTLRIGNPTVGTTNLICSSSHVGLRRYNDTAASGSTLTFIRLRDGTPTFDLSNGDLIGTLNSLGYVGTYLSGPSIDYSVSGTPSTGLGSKITLKTVGTAANTRYNVLELAASVASAVNYATITNSATNTPPILAAEGTDTDINLLLQTKGAGHVYVKDEAGNWESIEADDFVNNSPKVYNAGLAELIAMTDVNDHKQLPAEVKRVYQDPIMRTEIQSKLIMDEETKKESVRDVEVQVVDHYEERVAESLGSAVQWLKRSLQQEHQEKVILEQRVQTLEQQLNELLELMKM